MIFSTYLKWTYYYIVKLWLSCICLTLLCWSCCRFRRVRKNLPVPVRIWTLTSTRELHFKASTLPLSHSDLYPRVPQRTNLSCLIIHSDLACWGHHQLTSKGRHKLTTLEYHLPTSWAYHLMTSSQTFFDIPKISTWTPFGRSSDYSRGRQHGISWRHICACACKYQFYILTAYQAYYWEGKFLASWEHIFGTSRVYQSGFISSIFLEWLQMFIDVRCPEDKLVTVCNGTAKISWVCIICWIFRLWHSGEISFEIPKISTARSFGWSLKYILRTWVCYNVKTHLICACKHQFYILTAYQAYY